MIHQSKELLLVFTILIAGVFFSQACSVTLDDFYTGQLENIQSIPGSINDTTSTSMGTKPGESSTTDTQGSIPYSTGIPTNPDGNYAEPVAILTGAPTDTVTIDVAYITVSGTDVSHYRYKINQHSYGEPISVDQAIELTGLENGSITLSVIGGNPAGQWQVTPTTATWTVDASVAIAQMNNLPPVNAGASSATITVSGPGVVEYRYQLDGSGYTSDTPVTSSIVLTGLADGMHTLEVKGKNELGLWQLEPTSYTWTVDTAVAPPTVTDPPEGTISINTDSETTTTTSVTISLNITDNSGEGIGWIRFSNDNVVWGAWIAYAETAGWTLENIEGEKTVYAQALDLAGQLSIDPITDTIKLDLNDPSGTFNLANSDTSTLDVELQTTTADGPEGSGVTKMKIKTGSNPWSDWVEYQSPYAYTMDPGPFGTREVSVCFKDASGRESAVYTKTTTYTSAGANDQIYVSDTDGNDGDDGLTPANAKKTIGAAITAANAGGIPQVHVASATYNESITMIEGVSVFGGYSADFSSRDVSGNPTYIIATSGTNTVDANGTTVSTVIDGFDLTAPTSGGDTTTLNIAASAGLTVSNCQLENKNVGGTNAYGLFIGNGANPNIRNIDISLDSTATNVYAIYVDASATPTIEEIDIDITNGSPTNKWGIYLGGGSQAVIKIGTISNTNNKTMVGIYGTGTGPNTLISQMDIRANTNTGGKAIVLESSSQGTIERSFLRGGYNNHNDYTRYVGIQLTDSSPLIKNNIIYGNSTTGSPDAGDATAILIQNGSPIIANNTISASRIDGDCRYNTTNLYCIFVDTGNPVVVNNILETDEDYYMQHVGYYENNADSDPAIFNNNCFPQTSGGGYTHRYYYDVDVEGWIEEGEEDRLNDALKTNQSTPNKSQFNISNYSMSDIFVSPDSDWHLKPGSPAIDAGLDASAPGFGSVTVDYDGNPRTPPYDIGAFEN